jgi:hypothetical protein
MQRYMRRVEVSRLWCAVRPAHSLAAPVRGCAFGRFGSQSRRAAPCPPASSAKCTFSRRGALWRALVDDDALSGDGSRLGGGGCAGRGSGRAQLVGRSGGRSGRLRLPQLRVLRVAPLWRNGYGTIREKGRAGRSGAHCCILPAITSRSSSCHLTASVTQRLEFLQPQPYEAAGIQPNARAHRAYAAAAAVAAAMPAAGYEECEA